MPRITGLVINGMAFPFKEDSTAPYIIKKVNGIGDLSFDHSEINHNQFYTNGAGRDIGIVVAIKPTIDYHAVRRQIARAAPIDTDITITIRAKLTEDSDCIDYAQTICRVREVGFGFSGESPEVTLDLESIYTCFTSAEEITIVGLLFGLNTELPAVTHDYTPVNIVIDLVSPMAAYYRIYLSSDWLGIDTHVLLTNYGIDEIPEGTSILINSDEELFNIVLQYPKHLNLPDVNIETACEIGESGFRFIPNEPMMIETMKIPSSFSGETISLTCRPRISGV